MLRSPLTPTRSTSRQLASILDELNALPGHSGYVTETFCEQSRFFQPHNGERIDAVRDAIAADHAGTALEPLLLTSLSKLPTGWTPPPASRWRTSRHGHRALSARWSCGFRSSAGPGRSIAVRRASSPVQRLARSPPVSVSSTSPISTPVQPAPLRGELPHLGNVGRLGRARALRRGLQAVRGDVKAAQRVQFAPDDARRAGAGGDRRTGAGVSCSRTTTSRGSDLDGRWSRCARSAGMWRCWPLIAARYVGARIGIHNPAGDGSGEPGRLRNLEYVLVAGERDDVRGW